MKKLSAISLAIGLAAASAFPSLAQESKSIEIPGYLNPRTGAFRPQLARPTPDAAAKLTTYTGTLEFNFTIDLVTAVPSGQEVQCEATAEFVDLPAAGGSFENVISEQASAAATIKGSTATCTVKIPYSWNLASGATDQVSLNYSVAIVPTSITSEAGLLQTRRSSQELAPIPVPKAGATTSETIAGTI